MFIPLGVYLMGPVIFQGPCSSPYPIVVQIKGTLLAQTDLSLYTSEEWIMFENINGLIVIGGGTLDGQGQSVWKYSDCDVNDDCQRMPMVSINKKELPNAVRIAGVFFCSNLKHCRG